MHFYMAGAKLPLPLKVFPKLIPAWYGHLQGLEIIDGDNTFLIAQVSMPVFSLYHSVLLLFLCSPYPKHSDKDIVTYLKSA